MEKIMNKNVLRFGTAALLVASLSAGVMAVGAQDASGLTTDPAVLAAHPGRGNHPLAIVAEQLGLQPAELMTELQAGKTIAQLAEEKSVSLETISAAIIADRQTALAQAVTDGRLTQAQADAHLALMKTNLSAMFDKTFDAQAGGRGFGRGPGGFGGHEGGFGKPDGFGGPGRGHHGGFGGMFGGNGPQNAPAPEATVTPNA
jgi:hypothetical protein